MKKNWRLIMKKSYIHMQANEFKEKYSNYFQHKKKVRALENLNSVQEFEVKHSFSLTTIKSFLNDGFLEQEEEKFLDWLLSKYEIDYLEWAYRTKWLKDQMQRISRKNSKQKEAQKQKEPVKQLYMDFGKVEKIKDPSYNIPLNLLHKQKNGFANRV